MKVRLLLGFIIVALLQVSCTDGLLTSSFLNQNYTIILLTSSGIAISRDRAVTFDVRTDVNSGIIGPTPTAVLGTGQDIYCLFNNYVSVSNDGGQTFTNYLGGTNGIGGGPYDDSMSAGVVTSSGRVILGSDDGTNYTTNRGASFIHDTVFFAPVVSLSTSGTYAYAATLGNGVFISYDSGNNFTVSKIIGDGLPDNSLYDVASFGSFVYATSMFGLGVSSNYGASFVTKTTIDGLASNSLSQVAAYNQYVFVTSSVGLSVSSNNGTSFSVKTTANGLPSNYVYDVAFSVIDRSLYVVTDQGLALSRDYGQTFTQIDVSTYVPNTSLFAIHIY